MPTTFLESQGVLLKRGDGASPEVFALVPQIRDLSGPDSEIPMRDITTLDSTAREFSPGLKDGGEVTLGDIVWIPSNAMHAGLETDHDAKTLRNFTLSLTDSPATVYSFAAYVKSISRSHQIDEALSKTVTLKVSGAITKS